MNNSGYIIATDSMPAKEMLIIIMQAYSLNNVKRKHIKKVEGFAEELLNRVDQDILKYKDIGHKLSGYEREFIAYCEDLDIDE